MCCKVTDNILNLTVFTRLPPVVNHPLNIASCPRLSGAIWFIILLTYTALMGFRFVYCYYIMLYEIIMTVCVARCELIVFDQNSYYRLRFSSVRCVYTIGVYKATDLSEAETVPRDVRCCSTRTDRVHDRTVVCARVKKNMYAIIDGRSYNMYNNIIYYKKSFRRRFDGYTYNISYYIYTRTTPAASRSIYIYII